MATRFDPFQEMDRVLAQVLASDRAAATMPMDLYRDGDHYVLHVDLPGADPGTIDVSVDDRTLTIRAQRSPRTEHDVQWLAKERPVGTYARQLTVGRGLALDRISATYDDGVLTLSVPVAEEAKPRRIEIQHGASAPSTITSRDTQTLEQPSADGPSLEQRADEPATAG
ncbi:heat shock protein Hsp20 [Cellulomonas flavigena DSM 20109]|uniref:Heat shock protein Hsp20 n=1 Tax=Cellulomonas flavigena (strain ATCC 482 / DSM 20109 / BCRC 11376 / JCM 18109 / NBRC 3775 / NCIMB 8073 / NRS 134) TaxID=446466 RepID=D5UFQ9_CELFN|nr:Hsp20/alpha crystallin family protein [Cellulomonas flavigena]ADG73018.1 heat shock protein Hsp20 [Cellulomonas flavigena DSM 20109]